MSASLRPKRRGGPIPLPEQMEKMFDRFARGPQRRLWRQLRGEVWVPDTDVFDRDGTTIVRIDLPGVKREYIEISVEGTNLVIEGRREEETEEVKEEEYYSERPLGRFSRTVQLPETIDPVTIDATYRDGVLELTIPHPTVEPPRPVRVQVK